MLKNKAQKKLTTTCRQYLLMLWQVLSVFQFERVFDTRYLT